MAGNLAVTMTYEDSEPLIYACCWPFYLKYRGDFDEWVSEANLAFMEAYRTYCPDRGTKFTTWLKIIVDKRLMSLVRSKTKYSNRHICFSDQPDLRRKQFSLEKLLDNLSEEAREVAELVTDTPNDIKLAFYADRFRLENKARWEGYMIEFLRAVGWTTNQIADAFQEIKEALE